MSTSSSSRNIQDSGLNHGESNAYVSNDYGPNYVHEMTPTQNLHHVYGPNYMHEMAPIQNLHHLPIGEFSLQQLCGQPVIQNSIPYNLEPFNGYYVYGPNCMHEMAPTQNLHHLPIGGFSLPQLCGQPVLPNLIPYNLEPFNGYYAYGPNNMHEEHQPQNIHHPIGGVLVPQHCEQPVLSNSNPHNLEGFAGDYISMAKHQCGSLSLQKRIDEAPPQEIEMILHQLQHHVHDLMKHKYGHYVIKKLFRSRNVSLGQKNSIISFIFYNSEKLQQLCLDYNGHNFIQRLLGEDIAVEDPRTRDIITHAMRFIAFPLMKSFNGSLVLQHLLELFPSKENKKVILDITVENCLDIAKDRNGYRFFEKCIFEYYKLPAFDEIVKSIISNAVVLAEDPYGLSVNNHASNVVQKLFQFSRSVHAAVIARELMASPEFRNVLQDPYGNFVVETAMEYTEGALKQKLCNIILSHGGNLKSYVYGKNVLRIA
ncbi:hypothetical protein VNO78_25822 [Psophocarpus tetragonolobus]|uniref:PUM-HD domain-containing protein n=1 Tax=Psophocarpus tetragonolobus TaxID=3891 RepID=A0AAN9S6K3_PSOTE